MGAQQEFANAIDKILWEDWDPIGINEIPSSRDEYSGYVPQIFSLALGNSSVEEITKRLELLSQDLFEVDANRCKMVAEKILAIKAELLK